MTRRIRLQPGVAAALTAAALFGASTPLAKQLLADIDPWLLAGLLYLGSGLGLGAWRMLRRAAPVSLLRRAAPVSFLRRAAPVRLPRDQWPWLAGAVLCGGVVAPVLLMMGLTRMPASGVSLLLNAEGLFTALLAWWVFRENVDRRIATGMLAIVAGAVLLSWPSDLRFGELWPALAVLGACLAWGVDNNLTRKVALTDAAWIAAVKGLAAGTVNLLLALWVGAAWPPAGLVASAMALGLAAYGISLSLFVVALRHLGTARTGAYFSVAPFFGALLSVLWLGEALSAGLLAAGALMAVGVWLHLSERHEHEHSHEPLEHTHEHEHDLHHAHEHAHEHALEDTHADAHHGEHNHAHPHRHAAMTHAHGHHPDAHHGHRH